MSPPTAVAPSQVSGGSATPTKNELIEAARQVLDHFHIPFSNSKIFRLVINFKARSPQGGRYLFFQYLCSSVELSVEEQRRALRDPDIARVVSYNDPTGELAVNRVLRDQRSHTISRRTM